MYPCFQGYMIFVSLLFPLIRPRKVIHTVNVAGSSTAMATVVWEKFTVEYFHMKFICIKIFSSSRVANENFSTTN